MLAHKEGTGGGVGQKLDGEHSIFHISHGKMIRLFRRSGFEIEDLVEIGAPATASDEPYRMATVDWAQRWPNEQAWVVRKQ